MRDSKRAGNATQWFTQESMADSAKFDLPTSSSGGWGFAMAGDDQEHSFFSFSSAGVVTLIGGTANVTTVEDNDGKFNIFDSGSVVGINNELGSTVNVFVLIFYT
jgi:hypothetical protein